jgi:hypothetical protein
LSAWIPSVLLLFANGANAEDEWKFTAGAYGWLPDIDIRTESGQNVEITIADILDNLDLTVMLAGAARKGKWTFGADMIWLDLSHGTDEIVSPTLTLKNIDMQAFIFTPMVGYRVYDSGRHSVDLLAGARYLWLDMALSLDLTLTPMPSDRSHDIDGSGSNWDAIVGVKGKYRLSDKWSVPYYISAGAGQSDFTGQANASFAYEFEKFDAVIGWRYMTWDIGGVLDELTINGPFVGARFRF